MCSVHNAFDAGKSITRVSERGLGPGNQDFFGPCEMSSSRQASAISGRKKSRFPGPPAAQVMDLPACAGPYQWEVHRLYMSSHGWLYLVIKRYRSELPGPSAVNFSYRIAPLTPPPHLYTTRNSCQCGKLKSQNLLNQQETVTHIKECSGI